MTKKVSAIAVAVILLTGIGAWVAQPKNFFNSELLTAYLYAAALNGLNFFAAIALFSIGSTKKDNSEFLKFSFGGMVARLFLLIFSIFILIKFLNIAKTDFILIFFIIYFILLIVEIYFYKRKLIEN